MIQEKASNICENKNKMLTLHSVMKMVPWPIG